MCCFFGKVEDVKNMRIFARASGNGTQSLIYQIALHAKRDVAMVLPIPVKTGSDEKAVSFVNMEKYKNVFDGLEKSSKRSIYGMHSNADIIVKPWGG